MKNVGLFILLFFLVSTSQTSNKTEENLINRYSQLKEWFANSPSEYRSAPLLDYNEQITEEGIDFHETLIEHFVDRWAKPWSESRKKQPSVNGTLMGA